MKVNGCECSIVIKTKHSEMAVPYSEETLREAYSLLAEEAPVEGDGINKAIRKRGGVSGCVVTPLTIRSAPLLLCIAMGSAGLPVFVSETRSVYKYCLDLQPFEDADLFDLIQDRGAGINERKLYESCRVISFELRCVREEVIKLKLDISGEFPAVTYPYKDITLSQTSEMSGTVIGKERFSGDFVKYQINGKDFYNIYGLTLSVKKEGGTKTELWIKRSIERGQEIPEVIEELTITAQLSRDKYEARHFGIFRITVNRLVLTSDETSIISADTVIGPLRYYVSGIVTTEVFNSIDEGLI